MTRYSKADQDDARDALTNPDRYQLRPGDTVWADVSHVARSGMSRSIRLFIIRDNQPCNITHYAARLLGETMDHNHGGMKVSGCGMDMCFDAVYRLGWKLFTAPVPMPAGYWRNGPMEFETDPGYALKCRDL